MTLETLAVEQLRPSDTNRQLGDITELTASVGRLGVLQPILVRPISTNGKKPGHWEVIAGHRRYAAAKAAGLERVPVVIHDVDDAKALELQIIENLDREGLHPLDEAEGYLQLAKVAHVKVDEIARRVGRSVQYVWDRMKLDKLTPSAKRLFRRDRFSLGHAILLARLDKEQQEKAIDPDIDHFRPALFTEDRALLDLDGDDGKDPYANLKPVSVHEFTKWVDDHVRFDPAKVDAIVNPQAALALEEAGERAKLIPVTFSHFVAPEAREGRTYSERSWKIADGKEGPTCEHSRVGYVAVGPRRGEVFAVCINKDKCKVHWKEFQKQRERNKTLLPPVSHHQQQQEDPKLRRALEAAHQEADKAITKLVMAKAGALDPESFLRLILADSWQTEEGARELSNLGTKLALPTGRASRDLKTWAKLPLPLLQQAYAIGDENGLVELMGVDTRAIYDKAEKAAREAYKAEPKATPKATPKKKAKAKK